MKISQEQRDEIQIQFSQLKSVDDLTLLLSNVYKLINPDKKTIKIKANLITFFAYHATNQYFSFEIAKKNGKKRHITAPVTKLKAIQQNLNLVLNVIFKPNKVAHGFLLNRSIVSNAKVHTNKRFVFNIDLADFFPSIEFRRVKTVLQLEPFSLTDELAFLISNLCCFEGKLPQGAPTSPILSNIVCQRLDRKLKHFAKENRAAYSRYADDITFSSNQEIFTDDFVKNVQEIIVSENFKINEAKTRLQNQTQRQTVTGVVVNQKPNLSRDYIRNIRQILYNWEKKGLENAQNEFKQKDKNSKGDFIQVLRGRIEFLGMVRGKKDEVYLKLWEKYVSLSETKTEKTKSIKIINNAIALSVPKNNEDKIEDNEEDYYKNWKHNPKELTEFIKQFTTPGNPFQLLVHEEPLEIFGDLDDVLTRANELITNYLQKNGKLPSYFWGEWKRFEKAYKSTEKGCGKYIWENYEIPPSEDAEFMKDVIKPFKKSYRFGEGNDEETHFETYLLEKFTIDKKAKKFRLTIDNEINITQIYTDVERCGYCIMYIIQSIVKNSKGIKSICMKLEKLSEEYLIIAIVDEGSYFNRNPEDVNNWISSKLKRAKNNAWSVIDWYFESYFEGFGNYRIMMTKEPILFKKIVDKESKLQDVIHYLKFYR